MSFIAAARVPRKGPGPLLLVVIGSLLSAAILPFGPGRALGEAGAQHLLISEVVTGGGGASDELIEIYNPGPVALPLEGLELVYASASGLTVSRRAAWMLGAPELPAGRHLLVANELGAYASIADVLYASGMAAAGGSVALRIQGAETAIDALGWGTASSMWMEGSPAPAPAPGSSIERLPGGVLGSTQDTDDNAADFVERLLPDPQNTGSAPVPDPSAPPPTTGPTPSSTATASPVPTPTATPAPTVVPTATLLPSPIPGPATTSISTARALANGTLVTVEGTALTGSTFTDGGGYVADGSGGIAVLVSDGAFERGALLRVTGTVDDRFSQRTIRASVAQITTLGAGADPEATDRATGELGEPLEGALVRVQGVIAGSPTTLSTGLAFDVDDGSGAARVIVATTAGIDTGPWTLGAAIDVVGVVGQRDSTGTGTSGYRLQPRDADDVVGVGQPSPSASAAPSAEPSPPADSPTPEPDGVVSIAEARRAPKNARVTVRGVVTLAPGVVSDDSAVIQDSSGAILLRLGDEVGPLREGEHIRVDGMRSTKSGMESLRVTTPPVRVTEAAEPQPRQVRTGEAGEDQEAILVLARGALVASARRSSSGTAWFEIDDGSGPLRVVLGASLDLDTSDFSAGTWVEVIGVLGQETTGALPLRGYRIWPRASGELRVLAEGGPAEDGSGDGGSGADPTATGDGGGDGTEPVGSLESVGVADLSGVRVGATLVAGPWEELDVGGLLWDGERLVAIHPASAGRVRTLLHDRRPPLPVELRGLTAARIEPMTSITVVALGGSSGDLAITDAPVTAPATELDASDAARWVSVIGRMGGRGDERMLKVGDRQLRIDARCSGETRWPGGSVSVTGIVPASASSIIVPCGGVRPAPLIGRAAVAEVDMGAEAGSNGAPATEKLSQRDERNALAAVLLGAGALVLLGIAATRHRLGDGPEDVAVPPESPGAEDESLPDIPAPRALTLVSVPHERGSP